MLVMHMGIIIGSNFHRMSLEKNHNYLGTLCTLNLCGPMQQTNEGGAHYFVWLKNDAIRFKVIECIKSNTRDVVLACLKRFMAQLKHKMKNMLKILRNDRGSEFIGVELKSYLEQLEVKQEFTTNYTL